jgi:hypothetical protein
MKKSIYLLFVLAILVAPQVSQAQDEKEPKRPENIGVSDFDTFKNSSFDIFDESGQLKTDAAKVEASVKTYAATPSSATLEKLKEDYQALRGISKSSKELTDKIGSLDTEGKSLLTSAKNVSPRTKSPVATKNTNTSIKGLNAAKKNLESVSTIVTTNTKVVADELKKRGVEIEED